MKMFNETNYKLDDVFHAHWKERVWGDQKDHCFEGLLIVMKDSKGSWKLVDCFWGIKRLDNSQWSLEEAEKLFDLKWYCNLGDVERSDGAEKYYDDKDVFFLHEQHSCVPSCRYTYVRKGAKRSQEKMLSVIREKVAKEKRNIEYAAQNIELYSKEEQRIINGELDKIYL